ncbi:MAG: hypothetical protein ISS36_04675 [Candidatus Aenigmarchaeota archaeon]|nr:hypothetical protein [Candidatus Aenigmarchaeota archaeon]
MRIFVVVFVVLSVSALADDSKADENQTKAEAVREIIACIRSMQRDCSSVRHALSDIKMCILGMKMDIQKYETSCLVDRVQRLEERSKAQKGENGGIQADNTSRER